MRLGPENGSLTVKTGRTGAAAKAGHNLLIEVTAWEATLEEASLVLTVDSASLRVLEGTGGMQALGDDDKASIEQTIDEEVLKRQAIEFRSTAVQTEDGRLRVRGDLTLGGTTGPIELELTTDGGKLGGSAVVRQSEWGITPYSTLFGTLKVVDEVEVAIDATLPDQSV
ncbi:MAG: YceI family protein [Gaiellaceae bacterium]